MSQKYETTENSTTKLVCDIGVSGAFAHQSGFLNVAVSTAFGGGRLHCCRLMGAGWDLAQAISENSAALLRSLRIYEKEPGPEKWDDLTFQFGPRSFLCVDDRRILGLAETPEEAQALATKFHQAYALPAAPAGGSFYLINVKPTDITCEVVPLGAETILPDDAFSLHYGTGSLDWHREFTAKLNTSNHGLSILEGTPGTGKTSYLRHLMGALKATHRFYFIPTATMSVLSDPQFIGFWAKERRCHAERKFVVILEDSDAALMRRDTDNRDQVSAILNLSDGMLADFLRLQIICTINCRAADIDQALLRPGRLLTHRIFRKLDYTQATRLAEVHGRKLPKANDYSLAEVFADTETAEIARPRIGFAA